MAFTPATIEKPTLGDKAGFGFGLIPIGRSWGRYGKDRHAAAGLAKSDRSKAYQLLSRIERLLYWEKNRDSGCNTELVAAMALHAELLAQDNNHPEAIGLLLRAREIADLKDQPGALQRLAEALASDSDTSDRAFGIYVDHLSASLELKAAPSNVVCTFISAGLFAAPMAAMTNPGADQRSRTDRVLEAWPSCGFALYAKALASFHDDKMKEAADLAKAALDEGAYPELSGYIVHVSTGRMRHSEQDYTGALEEFEKARSKNGAHPSALLGIAQSTCDYAAQKLRAGETPDAVTREIIAKGLKAMDEARRSSAVDGVQLLRLSSRLHLYNGDLNDAYDELCKLLKEAPSPDILTDLIELLLLRGERDKALHLAKQGAGRYSDHSGVLRSLGDAHAALEQWAEAGDAYLSALGIDKTDLRTKLGAGRSLFETGQLERATPLLAEAAAGNSREGRYWLARTQLRMHMFHEAAEALSVLCEEGSSAEEHLYAASALAQSGEYREALELLSAVDAFGTPGVDVHLLRAKISMAAGAHEEAAAHLERASELSPDDPEAAYLAASLAFSRGEPASAVEALRELDSKCGGDTKYMFALSLAYLKAGDSANAEACAERCLENTPDYPGARSVLAVALSRQGQWSEVEQTLLVPDLAPEEYSDLDLWLLGSAFQEQGESERAVVYWEALATRHTDMKRLALNIERLHYQIGSEKAVEQDYEGAITAWCKFGGSRQDDEDLWTDIGELYFRIALSYLLSSDESRFPDAVEAIIEASKLASGRAKVPFYRGLLELRTGGAQSAAEWFEASVQLADPHLTDIALVWLGIARFSAGQESEAVNVLERAVEAAKSDEIRRTANHLLAIAHAAERSWKEAAAAAQAAVP